MNACGNENSASILSDNNSVEAANNSERAVKRPREDDSTAHLPKALKDMFGALQCDLCGVSTNSTLTAYTHYKGKVHQKKIDKYLRDNNISLDVPVKKSKNEFVATTCEICDVFLTSEIQSLQHYSGKSHKKNLANSGGEAKIKVKTESYDPSGRFGIGKSFQPPSALPQSDKPDSTTKGPKDSVHFCSVCSVFTNGADALASHMQGAKHQKKINQDKAAELNSLSRYRTPSGFYYCPSCDISTNSVDQFLIHTTSKKHLGKEK